MPRKVGGYKRLQARRSCGEVNSRLVVLKSPQVRELAEAIECRSDMDNRYADKAAALQGTLARLETAGSLAQNMAKEVAGSCGEAAAVMGSLEMEMKGLMPVAASQEAERELRVARVELQESQGEVQRLKAAMTDQRKADDARIECAVEAVSRREGLARHGFTDV